MSVLVGIIEEPKPAEKQEEPKQEPKKKAPAKKAAVKGEKKES